MKIFLVDIIFGIIYLIIANVVIKDYSRRVRLIGNAAIGLGIIYIAISDIITYVFKLCFPFDLFVFAGSIAVMSVTFCVAYYIALQPH